MKTKTKILCYKNDYNNIFKTLVDTSTIKSFIKEIEFASKTLDANLISVFKGDMLEVLAELYFNAFENDRATGIHNYSPTINGEDYGVDAIGTNITLEQVAVQVKYRSNINDLITYSDIAKTFTDGVINYNLDLTKNKSIYLFTTSKGITHHCDHVFNSRLVIINRQTINKKLNNNKKFWLDAYSIIQEVINE